MSSTINTAHKMALSRTSKYHLEVSLLIALLHVAGAALVLRRGTIPPISTTACIAAASVTLAGAYFVALLGRLQRRTWILIPYLLVTVYLVCIASAWFFRFRSGRFPGPLDFGLIGYLLHPYTLTVVERDILWFVGLGILLAAVFSFLIVRDAPAEPFSMWHAPACVLLAGGAVLLSSSDLVRPSVVASLPEASMISAIAHPPDIEFAAWYEPKSRPIGHTTQRADGRSVMILAIEALRHDAVTIRRDDGSYVMPFLAGLAEKGLLYQRSYAQASDSEMSSIAMLTGRYAAQHTLRPQLVPEFTFLSVLRHSGYRTAHYSAFELAWGKLHHEHADYFSDPAYDGGALELTEQLTKTLGKKPHPQEVVFRLDEMNVARLHSWMVETTPNRPIGLFFVIYGSHFPYSGAFGEAHSEYYFPPHEAGRVKEEYLRALTRADDVAARVVSRVLAHDPRAIIAITGDHGEEFYEHGGCLHAGALSAEVMNVPLAFIGLPERCRQPSSVSEPVGHIDIVPTLLDVVGVPSGLAYQGVSLCQPIEPERPLFASSRALRVEDAVIIRNKKYVVSMDGYQTQVYDLSKDPQELRNLATDPAESEIAERILRSFRGAQSMYHSTAGYPALMPPLYDRTFVQSLLGPIPR